MGQLIGTSPPQRLDWRPSHRPRPDSPATWSAARQGDRREADMESSRIVIMRNGRLCWSAF